MSQQRWPCLAETARPQPWHESAAGTRRNTRRSRLCLSGNQRSVKTQDPQTLHTCLYTQAQLTLHHCPESIHLLSPEILPQLTSLCHSAQVAGAAGSCSTPPQVFSVHFSLWRPDKCNSTTQCKADQYMRVVSKDSFITCPFTCLL